MVVCGVFIDGFVGGRGDGERMGSVWLVEAIGSDGGRVVRVGQRSTS